MNHLNESAFDIYKNKKLTDFYCKEVSDERFQTCHQHYKPFPQRCEKCKDLLARGCLTQIRIDNILRTYRKKQPNLSISDIKSLFLHYSSFTEMIFNSIKLEEKSGGELVSNRVQHCGLQKVSTEIESTSVAKSVGRGSKSYTFEEYFKGIYLLSRPHISTFDSRLLFLFQVYDSHCDDRLRIEDIHGLLLDHWLTETHVKENPRIKSWIYTWIKRNAADMRDVEYIRDESSANLGDTGALKSIPTLGFQGLLQLIHRGDSEKKLKIRETLRIDIKKITNKLLLRGKKDQLLFKLRKVLC